MHAGAQDLVGLRDIRIGELREGEGGLHLHARPHPARIEHALRIEALLDPPGQARRGRVLRLEHRHGGAQRGRRADQRRVAARRRPRARTRAAPPSSAAGSADPDQPAGPVVEVLGALPDRGRDLAPARRRGRDAPERAVVVRRTAARRGPPARARARPPPRAPRSRRTACSSASSACRRCATDGATPSSRSAVTAVPASAWTLAATGAGRCAAPDTSLAEPIASAHRARGRRIVEPEHQQRLLGFGARQHLDGDVGHRRERAPGAGEQLAEIVAGDVLHHPAARLEGLAAARHRRERRGNDRAPRPP